LKLKTLAHNIIQFWAGILDLKFRIVFWNICFGVERFEKRITLSEKKPPLRAAIYLVNSLVKKVRLWVNSHVSQE